MVTPTLIMWEIYKIRNNTSHGGDTSLSSMIYQVQLSIKQMIKMRFPWIKKPGIEWSEMIKVMGR